MSPGFVGGFFTLIPVFVILVFVFVFGMIIFTVVRSITYYSKNSSAPVLSIDARVVAKRVNVSNSMAMNGEHHHHHSHTRYFVTFEKETGERIELVLSGQQYGLLAEGDEGILTYQGEWFRDFKRKLE